MLHPDQSLAVPARASRFARSPRRVTAFAALLLGTTLTACDDATAPEPAPLTAEWVSAATGSDVVTGMPMSLELLQDGAVVTGSGTAVLPTGAAVALTASGTINGRVVTLVIDSEPAGSFPTTLLLQAMLGEDEQRLSGALTQEQLTEVRIFQRR